ncbi:MAG: AIR synthase-related protein [Patescibacteria group bacterium]
MAVWITIISRLDNSKASVYTIDARLSAKEIKRCTALLLNPLIEEVITAKPPFIEIGFLPGVTDNVGNTATEMLGHRTYSSSIYFKNPPAFNPLIQRASRNKFLPVPRVVLPPPHQAQKIDLNVSDEELMQISQERTLALDLASMRAIRDYRNVVTDVELEALAQTWSEHCKHTIFADPLDEIKDGLYRHYIKAATKKINKKFCVSVFSDNSGAIAFDDNYLITHKVETHNAPSAIDPFGGAITGIVAVNRDTLGFGLGAKPIANVYGFCLAPLNNIQKLYRDVRLTQPMLSTRQIMDGVIEGINAGGNQSGIPTPQGFLYFDDRYRGKPLVFAGTVGLIPRKVHGKQSHIKKALPGDYIVMLGGRVGADGIHGATFSSESLNPLSPASAVQIGDPITQKKFSDVLIREVRDLGLYHSITDNGAGGLSCSVGEMAKESGGCEVELDKVPLKYPGLEPWQIWISESQERMTLAVPPSKWKKFSDLMARRGVEATVIGKFTKSKKCVVKYHGKTVLDLDMKFLHDGRPVKIQKSTKPQAPNHKQISNSKISNQKLLELLASPNITSYEFVSRQYDHTVQGTAVIGPLQGKGMINGNSSVLAPVLGSKRGIVMSHALAPEMTEENPYEMAKYVIEQAIQDAVAIGADPDYIALLDNFCWCSSNDPERLWQLKEACRGAYDTAVAYGTPFISGKDSMFNDFKGYDAAGKPIKISILPTLLISALGVIPDVTKTVTEDLKTPGDLIYLLKANTYNLKAYFKAVQKNLINSGISIGRGGVYVALAKSAIGGQLGMNVELRMKNDESMSGIIVSISPENQKAFEKALPDAKQIGTVSLSSTIVIQKDTHAVTLSIKAATDAYHETFKNY